MECGVSVAIGLQAFFATSSAAPGLIDSEFPSFAVGHMVDAAALVLEINSTAAFLRSRRSDSPDQEAALARNLATTLELQIGRLRQLTAKDATALNNALVDAPYGDENMRRISAAIDTRLAGTAVRAQKSGALKNDPQHLTTPWYFMTKSDWGVFNDRRKPWDVKVGRCLFRLNALGITHPSYQAIKWCTAMLLIAHYEVLPSHQDIFQKVQGFKAAADSERRVYPHGHMIQYPVRPHDLAEVMREHAYEADDPRSRWSWTGCGVSPRITSLSAPTRSC